MNPIISLTKYNLKLLFRDQSTLLMALLMPVGFYLLFGYMLQNVDFNNAALSDLLVPLYLILIIGNAVINVFGTFYVQTKESGNLQKYKFLGISELRFSITLFLAISVFQLAVILGFFLFTYLYKGVAFPLHNSLPVILTIIVIEIFHFALTFFLIALLRRVSLYAPISLAVYIFQMFLGGLTFPIEMFPSFLQKLVYYINPVIYGRNALLSAWTGNPMFGNVWTDNIKLLGISIILLVLGTIVQRFIFSRQTTAILTQE